MALVLTRRKGESIFIGDDIEVTVVCVNGKQVKIAIKAPREVNIVRDELLGRERIDNKSGMNGAENG